MAGFETRRLRAVPWHFCEQECQPAGAGDTGEEESAAQQERHDGEPATDEQCEDRADCRQRTDDDLDLAHQGQNIAFSSIDGEPRIDPCLCATFHQNAVEAAAALESLNGLLGPGACLAKDIDGLARLVPLQKGFDVQVIQGDEPCAGNMGIDKFRRCANIEQLKELTG